MPIGVEMMAHTGPTRSSDLGPGSRVVQRAIFRKDGGYWTVGYGWNVVRLKDTRGLNYIAQLLRNPNAEFHVLDLYTQIGRRGADDETYPPTQSMFQGHEDLEKAGIHIARLGDAGEMLDQQAKINYRRRLSELHEELDEARSLGKVELAEQTENEIDALTKELSRAVGLGGRNRRAASASERARQSITKSIRSALETIAKSEAMLGKVLYQAVKTGTFCSYQPNFDFLIAWEFEETGKNQGERSTDHIEITGPLHVSGIAEPVDAGCTSSNDTLPRPSLAVLPFLNMSDDPEQEYFSDGITEDIIVDLSQVSALFVVAWNTAFTLKGKAVDIPEMARKLNVRYLLEGSVRRAGKTVRITAQLIDGATGGHLWAERYDREFGDVLALQDDIRRNVVSALKVRLLPTESKSIADRSASNAEAYEYYLKGRSKFFETWGSSCTMKLARELFAKAAEIEPTYAKAYTGIANCDAFLWISGDLDVSYEDLLAMSSKALKLAPDMAEAHASRGIALWVSGEAQEAAAAFEQAIRLDAFLFEAHFFYAVNCRDRGDFGRAAALLERAAELRSDDFASLTLLANIYELQDRLELATETARRSLIRIESTLSQRPNAAEVLGVGAATLVYLGESARAVEWATRAISLEANNFTVRYNTACTFAVIGEVSAALEHLEYIVSHMPRARSWLLKMIKNDPQFALLHGLSDYQAFMECLASDADAGENRAAVGNERKCALEGLPMPESGMESLVSLRGKFGESPARRGIRCRRGAVRRA